MVYITGQSDLGKVRANNEDVFVAETIWDDNHFLAVVIDGVGGQEGGEVAAALAKDRIRKYLLTYKDGERERLLKEAVTDANNAIFTKRADKPLVANMSCVLTACIADTVKRKLYMSHVGDTRLYHFSQGELLKLSHDHSLVGFREEKGDLSEEEAMAHPQRNIINRDVGSLLHKTDDDDFIESESFDITQGSIFLLCSDGLSDMITSQQITAILNTGDDPELKASNLIAAANDAGGRDNITVVLIDFSKEPVVTLNRDSEKDAQILITATEEIMSPATIRQPVSTQPPSNVPIAPGTQERISGTDQKATPAKEKERFSGIKKLLILLLGCILGIAIMLLIQGSNRSKAGDIIITPPETPGPTAAGSGATVYEQLTMPTRPDTEAFSLQSTDTIILDKPLVISKNRFKWLQSDSLCLRSEDSLLCPIGLIIISDSCNLQLANIKFSGFKKNIVDLGKKNIITTK